jgi:hypothetical protein
MSGKLRLRIHVNEPFDFERENESPELFGVTRDHERDVDEWEIDLDRWFTFNESEYDAVLIGPRYVGEHLDRVHNALLGVPVRIAHRTPDGWHYAMTGMLSIPPEDVADREAPPSPDYQRRGDSTNSEGGTDI